MHHVSEETIEFFNDSFSKRCSKYFSSVPTFINAEGGEGRKCTYNVITFKCYGFLTRHLDFLMIFFHKIIGKSSIIIMCMAFFSIMIRVRNHF